MSQEPTTSLYDALHVLPTATTDEIRRAYRSLAQRTHPDRLATHAQAATDGAAADGGALARINRAYEVLSDAHRRAQYDAARRPPAPLAAATASLPRPRSLDRYRPAAQARSRRRWWWAVPPLLLAVALAGWAWRTFGARASAQPAVLPADQGLQLTPSHRLTAPPAAGPGQR